MINWKEIKEEYPKALISALQYLGNDFNEVYNLNGGNQKVIDIYISSYLGHGTDRKLYDFFDGNGINIGIDEIWSYWIQTEEGDEKNNYFHIVQGGFKTRTEAEAAAFKKAFELLETKLTNNE